MKVITTLHRAFSLPATALLMVASAMAFFTSAQYIPALALPDASGRAAAKSQSEGVKFTVKSAGTDQRIMAKFKAANDFAGGDSAYSVRLSPDKTAWLFSEAFTGNLQGGKRSQCKLARNLIAIDDLSKPDSKPSFFRRGNSFFKIEKNIIWPGDGFMLDGRLYIFGHEVETSAVRQSSSSFNPYTDYLMVVLNPLDSPEKWRWMSQLMGNRSSQKWLGTACLLYGDYAYIYCCDTAQGRGMNVNPVALARIKKADLKALTATSPKSEGPNFYKTKFEWLAGGWQKECAFLDSLWDVGSTEMSVTRLPGMEGLFAFYLPPNSKSILMRHASKPEGPWSAAQPVYSLPQGINANTSEILAANVKAHPEYSNTKGDVVLTYCTRGRSYGKLLQDGAIYFPQAVKIHLTPTK